MHTLSILYLQANFTLYYLKLSHSQPLRGTDGSSFSGKKSFFCNQTRANLEFSLGLKRHSRKKIKKNNLLFFFLSFSSINKFGHWDTVQGWDNNPIFEDLLLAPASRIKSISGLTEPTTTCHLWATYALKSVCGSDSK